MIKLIVIISLSFFYNVKTQQDCLQINPKCLGWLSNIVMSRNISGIPFNTFFYSGIGVSKYGNFEECTNNEGFNFAMMNANIAGVPSKNGFCIPNVCAASDLNKCKDIIGGGLTSLVGSPVYIDSFKDPVNDKPTLGPGGIVFIIFICLLFFVQAAAGGYNMHLKFSKVPIDEESGMLQNSLNNMEEKAQPKPIRKSLSENILDALDIIENTKLVFHFPESMKKNPLRMFNGLRFFAMSWVILGHEYLIKSAYGSNIYSAIDVINTVGFSNFVLAGLFSVDMFFFIGGFFTAYALVRRLEKMSLDPLKYTMLFVHRFLRIWPSYAFCIIFTITLFPVLITGPNSLDAEGLSTECSSDWWKNMIFLDNYLNSGKGTNYCFGWGWYLSNDMQLFLLSPILIFIYIRNRKLGYSVMAGFIFMIWIITLILTFAYDLKAYIPFLSPMPEKEPEIYYIKPYVRGDVYIFGLIIGCFYLEISKYEDNFIKRFYFTNPLTKRLLTYIIGSALTIGIIFGSVPLQKDGPDGFSTEANVFHLLWTRFAFVVGVFIVIIPGLFTNQCYLLDFLGSYFFVPLGKLSFNIYLVHLLVLLAGAMGSRSSFYLSHGTMIYQTIIDLIVAIIFGFIVAVLIENPASKFQRMLLEKQTGRNK